MKKTLRTAVNTVAISSYTLSSRKLLEGNIGDELLSAAKRGIKLYIYVKRIVDFTEKNQDYIQKIRSACVQFEEINNHAKFLIKNDAFVAIGSYDWLSDMWHDASNGTLVVMGELSTGLTGDI
ncbi:MAG: phospholipase D-like domain-containing protein [Alphaproteobacteria bacterium]